MHIEYFRYFYEVGLFNSISKVASNSHISQSAISQQLHKLESLLGVKLLERSNKGVKLTNEGKIVFKHSSNMLSSYNRMIEELNVYEEGRNVINIDTCWTIAAYSIPSIICDLRQRFPQFNINITTNNCEAIEINILQDMKDIGIMYNIPNDRSIIYHKLKTDRLVLVSSLDMDITNEINLEELLEYPIVMLSGKLNAYETIASGLLKINKKLSDLKIIFSVDSIEPVKSFLKTGHAISLLPYLSIKDELEKKQLKEIIIKNLNFEYNVYLIYRMEAYNKLKNFIDYFVKSAKQI